MVMVIIAIKGYYLLGIMLAFLDGLSHLIITKHYEAGTAIILTLHVTELKLTDAKLPKVM